MGRLLGGGGEAVVDEQEGWHCPDPSREGSVQPAQGSEAGLVGGEPPMRVIELDSVLAHPQVS